jgi:magnesium chelatase family protein
LFLDQAPRFRRKVLDVLRQPLESGEVTLERGGLLTRFPARFLLVVSATWCPCGNHRSPAGMCCCPREVRRGWLRRLSGPLLDRCAVKAVMTPPAASELITPGESTAVVAARVLTARERAAKRLAGTPWQLNSKVPADELLRLFMPAPGGWEPIGRAVDLGRLSNRAAASALRVAWTLADLGGRDRPGLTDCRTALEFQTGDIR